MYLFIHLLINVSICKILCFFPQDFILTNSQSDRLWLHQHKSLPKVKASLSGHACWIQINIIGHMKTLIHRIQSATWLTCSVFHADRSYFIRFITSLYRLVLTCANYCPCIWLLSIHFFFFNINRNTIISSLCTIKDYKVEKIVESLHCDGDRGNEEQYIRLFAFPNQSVCTIVR